MTYSSEPEKKFKKKIENKSKKLIHIPSEFNFLTMMTDTKKSFDKTPLIINISKSVQVSSKRCC